jgi:hypothetical protein
MFLRTSCFLRKSFTKIKEEINCIDFGRLDLNPHWECRYGSRSFFLILEASPVAWTMDILLWWPRDKYVFHLKK